MKMDPSQQNYNQYFNSQWWNTNQSNNWHMDPHKTGALNQPPPAHNAPSQYPPPQAMPMAQAIPSGYNLPKPAHTGSSMGMAKCPQGMQQGGVPSKQISNVSEKSYPMMPPKALTPPNHSPISTPSMPKMPQIPSLIPSVSSKTGCMPQSQQPYQQFQQRLNPQLQFQPQTAQQNLPIHTNQSQVNAHNMPPYPQAQNQKMQLSNQNASVSKQDLQKGPTPPIPDLISITKPATSQPLPPSPMKSDITPQCPQVSAKTTQNVSSVPYEGQKMNSHSELPYIPTPQDVQISSENKPLNSSVPTGKVSPAPTKVEVNKSTNPAIVDAGSTAKIPDSIEVNESQEQSISDKNTTVSGTKNLNGIPCKPQLKMSPLVVSKANEPLDNRSSGEISKKNIPAPPPPAKGVAIPIPKTSLSVAAPLTKAPVMQAKPAASTTSLTPSKSSQPLTKQVVIPSKPLGVHITSQPISAVAQVSPKSSAGTLTSSVPSIPVVQADDNSNIQSSDATISQIKQTSEIDNEKQETISPKIVKADNGKPKPEIPATKTAKSELPDAAKALKMDSIPTKTTKIENLQLPLKTIKIPAATKSPRKKETSPKTPKVKPAARIKPERSTRTVATPKTPSEGERKSKRTRNPTAIYQSPAVEAAIRIPRSLVITPRTQEKLIIFFKNEHVAVRNPDGAFYICQLAQNVYKSTRKLKIRWLSPSDDTDTCEIFKPDYYDVTDFDCILTSVVLEKKDRSTYRLPPAERERILNILQRALDKEKGIDTSRDDLVENHPDGLDISLYNNEEQLQLKMSSKRSTRTKRESPEDTTDEDSEEMKDLGDDSEDDKDEASESEEEMEEDEESEEEMTPPPPKVALGTPAKSRPRDAGRAKTTLAKKEPEPLKTPASRTLSTRNKRTAAAASLPETSPVATPTKVARTLRTPAKSPAAKRSKPTPKTTRRTRK